MNTSHQSSMSREVTIVYCRYLYSSQLAIFRGLHRQGAGFGGKGDRTRKGRDAGRRERRSTSLHGRIPQENSTAWSQYLPIWNILRRIHMTRRYNIELLPPNHDDRGGLPASVRHRLWRRCHGLGTGLHICFPFEQAHSPKISIENAGLGRQVQEPRVQHPRFLPDLDEIPAYRYESNTETSSELVLARLYKFEQRDDPREMRERRPAAFPHMWRLLR